SIASLEFAEGLYADYLKDPASVPADWRAYFDDEAPKNGVSQVGPSFRPRSVFNAAPISFAAPAREASNGAQAHVQPTTAANALALQDRVDALVRAYRVRGHMMASIDPLGLPRASQPELDPAFYDLGPGDL